MAQQKLEERLAAVEKELLLLRATVEKLAELRDWRSAAGMFTGDETMKRIIDEGRKIREADRRRTRKTLSSRKKSVQP